MHIDQIKDIAFGAASGALASAYRGPVGMLQGATVVVLTKAIMEWQELDIATFHKTKSFKKQIEKETKNLYHEKDAMLRVLYTCLKILQFAFQLLLTFGLMAIMTGAKPAALTFAATAFGIECAIWAARAVYTLATDTKFRESIFGKKTPDQTATVPKVSREDAKKILGDLGSDLNHAIDQIFPQNVDINGDNQ